MRELAPEPVITELMRYFERDEARHVGLGMQYLPLLVRKRLLGIDPRFLVERGRSKQLAAMTEAFRTVDDGRRERWRAARRAFGESFGEVGLEVLVEHGRHAIRTARGQVAPGGNVSSEAAG